MGSNWECSGNFRAVSMNLEQLHLAATIRGRRLIEEYGIVYVENYKGITSTYF